MKKFKVTGMSCAACSARVEKAVSHVEGVTECNVSLLTGSMSVKGEAKTEVIIKAVTDCGYGACVIGEQNNKEGKSKAQESERGAVLRRLIFSGILLIILMYMSMGHMIPFLKLPSVFAENCLSLGFLQLLISSMILIINQKFFISGFRGVLNKAPNMDTLVSLGSGASFIYSVYTLFKMSEFVYAGEMENAKALLGDLYFESAAMILVLITVGKLLEAIAKGKTTNALNALMALAPENATVFKDGKEKTVPIKDLRVDDILVCRSGQHFPADAIIVEGGCTVDESSLTGESIPVEKTVGDRVSAGTVNVSGYIKCKTERVGEDTTLSQIIKMVSDAASSKAPIAKLADKVSGVFVPCVIAVAVITFIIWMIADGGVGFALSRAISVLVISCPCALGLATPVAIMVGSGVGARNGILFKNAVSLEESGKVRTVVFDKTGTLTCGRPAVTDILTFANHTENEVLQYAYSLETGSEHPLARAIIEKAKEKGICAKAISDFRPIAGRGLNAIIDGKRFYGGNFEYISSESGADFSEPGISEKLSLEGKTVMYFAFAGEMVGAIAVMDTVKQDSADAISDLKAMGMRVVMLTGDNEKTAKAVGRALGIDNVIAQVMPAQKAEAIEQLKTEGKVAMVGDGVNDAPALTGADIGIAIGAGTDVAIDAAEVVLVNNSASDAVKAIRLSKATLCNIKQNLFWAFCYNVIGIPVAAGALSFIGITLSPMLGAAMMSLSSFCVVTNALRLNFVKLSDKKTNSEIKKENKENKTMETVMNIQGMMCPHCEARVKKCLEGIEGVTEAAVSFKDGKAVVKTDREIAFEVLKKAVEDQGYEVR